MSPRAPGFVPPALVTSSPDSQPRASVGVHRGGEIQTGKRTGKPPRMVKRWGQVREAFSLSLRQVPHLRKGSSEDMSFRLETNQPHPHPPSLLKHHPGRVAHPWVSEMRTAPKRQSADPGLTPELGERETSSVDETEASQPRRPGPLVPQESHFLDPSGGSPCRSHRPSPPAPRCLGRARRRGRPSSSRPGPGGGDTLLPAPRARPRGHRPRRPPRSFPLPR